MRVTDQQMFTTLAARVASGWSKLAEAQEQIATGRKVNSPSDNPVAAEHIGALEESIARLADHDRAADSAQSLLEATEGALGEASNLLIRARELAVQAASEQWDTQARADTALEVRAMIDGLVALGNTEVTGRYIFAGFLSDQPAFQPDGTFQGDSGEVEMEVSPGLMVKATVRGDEAFSGAGGGVDLFATLDALAVALETDDTSGIQASLGGLDTGIEQVQVSRSRAGARHNAVVTARSWNERLRVGFEANLGRTADTDLARASMEFALAQQALEATLATVPNMLAQSILDRL